MPAGALRIGAATGLLVVALGDAAFWGHWGLALPRAPRAGALLRSVFPRETPARGEQGKREWLCALLGVEPSSSFPLPPSRSAPLQAGGPRPQLGHHRQQGRAALHRDGRLPAAHLPLVPGHHADAQRPQNQPDLQELLLHAGFHHRGAGECLRSGRGDPRPPQPRSRSSPLPLQTFEPVTSFDTGDYYCEAPNNVGSPQKSDVVHMEASE